MERKKLDSLPIKHKSACGEAEKRLTLYKTLDKDIIT